MYTISKATADEDRNEIEDGLGYTSKAGLMRWIFMYIPKQF